MVHISAPFRSIATAITLKGAKIWPQSVNFSLQLRKSDRLLDEQDFSECLITWPSPDPIVQDLDTFKIAEEQPYIYRLSYLGVEAQRRGLGAEFVYEVSHLLFGGQQNWHEGAHLANAAARAWLNLEEMENAIRSNEYLSEIEKNQDKLSAAGGWGVPTMVFEGEPFFGQDRIETLRWQLSQKGLAKV